jgi:hypothetical protein
LPGWLGQRGALLRAGAANALIAALLHRRSFAEPT